MSAVLRAREVTVDIGGRRILDGVDVELHAGELLVLVGPNGAGKSTLLSVLAGDRAPTSGVVELDGALLDSHPVAERARKRSVLTQSNDVSFPFAVEEVVRMGRAPWRHRPEAALDDEMVAAAMEAGEVEGFASRAVTALSGGERARTAFARSFAQQCRIALLDEPTASLDIRHQHRVLARTRDRVRRGGAAVVVLHDLNLAAAYADRIALLERGRLAAVDAPRAVLSSALLTRVYRHPIHVASGVGDSLWVIAEPSATDHSDIGEESA
ncbi:heme ABC transporter ATP-binding protein [Herbiconiux sp. A18JL235]|uniref:Heme ABC transporter ATP-binding protein n=1 Tax=Herbiconiux sp. A18JL235 TaxID=3152363 RepID=A0AB39BFT2_9MICO